MVHAPPIGEPQPSERAQGDHTNRDEGTVRSEIPAKQWPALLVHHDTCHDQHRSDHYVREKQAESPPRPSPRVNEKPKQKPRQVSDDGENTEDVANPIQNQGASRAIAECLGA
jgi:hypothetical protein